MSYVFCFFFKQKTAYELRISDWSSDVCSSDLQDLREHLALRVIAQACGAAAAERVVHQEVEAVQAGNLETLDRPLGEMREVVLDRICGQLLAQDRDVFGLARERSEEHTSELQSLMRISYAVFCLKKKKQQQ